MFARVAHPEMRQRYINTVNTCSLADNKNKNSANCSLYVYRKRFRILQMSATFINNHNRVMTHKIGSFADQTIPDRLRSYDCKLITPLLLIKENVPWKLAFSKFFCDKLYNITKTRFGKLGFGSF